MVALDRRASEGRGKESGAVHIDWLAEVAHLSGRRNRGRLLLGRLTPRAPIARREKPVSGITVVGMRLAIVVAVLVGWELAARAGLLDTFFWSSPAEIGRTGFNAVVNGGLVYDALFTFASTVGGFVLGVLGGVLLGLSFWWSRTYTLTVEPFIVVFQAVPKLALAPLVVLLLGLGFSSKLVMAVALVIVVQTLNTYTAVRAVDSDLTTLLYSLGASRMQVFLKVVVPSTLPWIASSLRVAIGLSLTGAIVGEFIGSYHGLGKVIQYAGQTYNVAMIWVGIAALALLALLLYSVVGMFERKFLKGHFV